MVIIRKLYQIYCYKSSDIELFQTDYKKIGSEKNLGCNDLSTFWQPFPLNNCSLQNILRKTLLQTGLPPLSEK